MFRETGNIMSEEAVVEVYYKISDVDGVFEETIIKNYVRRNRYSATKFNFGNMGIITVNFVNIVDNSVVLKFDVNESHKTPESTFNFDKMFLIPENLKYENKNDEIIICNGKAYDLNYPNNSTYNKKYTIGIKSIKYGEFLER